MIDDPTTFFLEALYANMPADEWISLFSTDAESGQAYVDWSPVNDLTRLKTTIAQRAERCNVWIGVATRKAKLDKGRGGRDDCALLPGLWLDIDITGPNHKTDLPLPLDTDDAFDLIRTYPIPPSFVVHTGGGLQPYWLFDEPRPVSDLDSILPAWHHTFATRADELGWHLDNTSDPARILRVPGTFNRKGANPQPVTIMELSQ